MAYTDTWNTAFEALPAGSDDLATADERIREVKRAVRERMNVDHYMDPAGTDADHGLHRKVTFRAQIAAPGARADAGHLYIKDVSGKVQLFFQDEDGNQIQLTSSGAVMSQFPSGTKLPFYQNTAPAGWTIDTSLDDMLFYITKGSAAGGNAGGAGKVGSSWTISGFVADSHALTIAEMPPHYHTYGFTYFQYSGGDLGGYDVRGGATPTSTTGSGAGHTHTCSNNGAWRPYGACFIICSKD